MDQRVQKQQNTKNNTQKSYSLLIKLISVAIPLVVAILFRV